MCKIEIEHKEESQFPCFGIMKYSDGLLVVQFSAENVGVALFDSRPNEPFKIGEIHADWNELKDWDIVTKEFTLKFSL
jgi:hypothetical protein